MATIKANAEMSRTLWLRTFRLVIAPQFPEPVIPYKVVRHQRLVVKCRAAPFRITLMPKLLLCESIEESPIASPRCSRTGSVASGLTPFGVIGAGVLGEVSLEGWPLEVIAGRLLECMGDGEQG
jgi:hypothetical protein